ncbi:MAG: Plasmid stabilization system [uncultured bacterium]|nr:MAG: Plasmid stabilization system [uncultured bacterium]
MIIKFDSKYIKSYRKRIRNNIKVRFKVADRIKLFVENQNNPIIKDHQLTGAKKDYRAFWITGDIRIIYFPVSKDEVLFIDIGTHNQVY